jgi:hypothetical protein
MGFGRMKFHFNGEVDGGVKGGQGLGLGRSNENVVDEGRPRTGWLAVETEKEASNVSELSVKRRAEFWRQDGGPLMLYVMGVTMEVICRGGEELEGKRL